MSFYRHHLTTALLAAALTACSDPQRPFEPAVGDAGHDASHAATASGPAAAAAARSMPGEPGDARDRLFYKVNLQPVGEFGAVGVALVDVVGGVLRVRIHATHIATGANIPQHIHQNPGCNPGGAVLINLDAGLTVPGESPAFGGAFPTANQAGVMNYEATRSLADLRAALNTYVGTTLADDAELLAWLDLEDRNIHMHLPVGPPFPAVTCGPMELMN